MHGTVDLAYAWRRNVTFDLQSPRAENERFQGPTDRPHLSPGLVATWCSTANVQADWRVYSARMARTSTRSRPRLHRRSGPRASRMPPWPAAKRGETPAAQAYHVQRARISLARPAAELGAVQGEGDVRREEADLEPQSNVAALEAARRRTGCVPPALSWRRSAGSRCRRRAAARPSRSKIAGWRM